MKFELKVKTPTTKISSLVPGDVFCLRSFNPQKSADPDKFMLISIHPDLTIECKYSKKKKKYAYIGIPEFNLYGTDEDLNVDLIGSMESDK